MNVVTVHRGSRDGYQVARALQEAGILQTLVTDTYWPSDLTWAKQVERTAPAAYVNALRARTADGLPGAAVSCCWASGLTSLAASKTKHLPFDWQRRAIRWCDRDLGRKAGRIAGKTNAALLSYSYYAHSAFSNMRGNQPRILFQLHPHPASVRSILLNERRLHPDCATSLDREWELALPDQDFRELNEEITMAHHWVVASTFTKRTLEDAGIPSSQVKVIPYGIDLSSYPGSAREVRAQNRPLRLLFVGTLAQRKGIKYLVEALELLPAGAVTLTVCGRPVDDLAVLRSSRIPIDIRPSVSAAGLLDAYREADVFVFPSLAEGFAQVLLEAMASGLPIISTNRTAAPDLIEHGREGFIMNPGSAFEVAHYIQEFLRDPTLARTMGEAARRRAEQFSWQRFRTGLATFVQDILESRIDSSQPNLCLSR